MHDDFSALDFLSFGDLRLSTSSTLSPFRKAKKKLLPVCRRAKANGRLALLLPFLAGKPQASVEALGWPVPLSWPRHTISNDAFICDHSDRQAS